MTFVKIYSVAVAVFFLIDMVWLGVIAKNLYRKYIGHLMLATPNWSAAIIFYLLFVVGLVIFAINPALSKNSWSYALLYGAMFGFFTYMTFDLTSLAVIKGWSWEIVVIDIIWGIVLAGSVSAVTYFICSKYLGL